MDQAPDELSNASEEDVQDLTDTPLDQLPGDDDEDSDHNEADEGDGDRP